MPNEAMWHGQLYAYRGWGAPLRRSLTTLELDFYGEAFSCLDFNGNFGMNYGESHEQARVSISMGRLDFVSSRPAWNLAMSGLGQKRNLTILIQSVGFGPQSDISNSAEAERRNLTAAIFFG